MLTKEEFTKEVFDYVKDHFKDNEDYEVGQCEVVKNNSTKMFGISLKNKDVPNISPVLYIDDMYEAYDHGEKVDHIAKQCVISLENALENPPIETQGIDFDISDYDFVKNHVYVKVLSKENNDEYIKDLCQRTLLNMVIVPYVLLDNNGVFANHCSVTLKREYLKNWNVTEDELIDEAIQHTMNLFKYKSMAKTLDDMKPGIFSDEEIKHMEENPAMYVMSTSKALYGASVLTSPDFLDNCLKKENCDRMVIIPSSVHEIIAIMFDEDKSKDIMAPEEVTAMIREVNDTQLASTDILSYTPYYKELGKDLQFYCDVCYEGFKTV